MKWMRLLTLAVTVLLGLAAAAPPLRAQFPIGRDFRVSDDPGGPDQVNPRAAAAPDGRFAVTWVEAITSFRAGDVKVRFFDALGRPRGAAFAVAEDDEHRQELPAIAMAPNGSFVVVWLQPSAASVSTEIFARAFGPGGRPRGPAFQVAESTVQKGDADVAIGADGVFVVAWSEAQGSGSTVRFRRFAPGGQPLGPDQALDTTSRECFGPRVAVNPPSGDFAVTCVEVRRPGRVFFDIFLRLFHRDGSPDGSAFVPHGSTFATRSQPEIALAPDGRLGVVWEDQPTNSPGEVRSRRFEADGSPLGPVQRLSTGRAQQEPKIAALADGSFFTAWIEENGLLGRILGPAASSRGPQFRLGQRTANNLSVPNLGLAPTGRGVVVWQQGFSFEARVFARRLVPAL